LTHFNRVIMVVNNLGGFLLKYVTFEETNPWYFDISDSVLEYHVTDQHTDDHWYVIVGDETIIYTTVEVVSNNGELRLC